MAFIKPSLPKGTRDFSPVEMDRRNFIFDTIRSVFRKYGFRQIETPAMENLSTLTGKYGDEGDQLIFKILNSGNFLESVSDEKYQLKDSNSISSQIAEKALRYDLTVPFARYVVAHQNDITFPFKRFQIQAVWRADRPQKGRYREFYQCDADVVGSDSLLNEAEFVLIYQEALKNLGLKDFTIKINNRKILSGIAEILNRPELIIDMTIAIDKMDKIGMDGVKKELLEKGFLENEISTLIPVLELNGSNEEKLNQLKNVFSNSVIGLKGIDELETVFSLVNKLKNKNEIIDLQLDLSLARGLNYYTGAIFEVKSNEVNMGSIGGGGRYDDLTSMFGLKNISGVGISFGADRIYDVMEELNLFSNSLKGGTQVLIINFGSKEEEVAIEILKKLRAENISSELYPTAAKLQKQMKYADDNKIPFVIFSGAEEQEKNSATLKNMESGKQEILPLSELIAILHAKS